MKVNLSDGEWKLMKLLWEDSPRTIAQLVDALANDTGWKKNAVFVMLRRLEAKGAVAVDASGRSQLYSPLVRREDATLEETESFLDRVWDGSVSLLITSLAGQKRLSDEDIAVLKKLVDDAEREMEK